MKRPSPLPGVLGGEERIEDVLHVLGRDARPGVGDVDDAPVPAVALLDAGRDLDAAACAGTPRWRSG